MKQTQLLGILRHALSAIGGFAIYKGHIDAQDAEQLIGLIITLFAAVWSIWEKR
jgi:hypothetical protein